MKKTWRLAVPLAALALLSGCVPWGGTAFTVDGSPVSSRAVDAAVSGCAAAFKAEASSDLRLTMVSWMIAGKVADTVASKTNQTITDAERQQFLNASAQGQATLTDPECAKVGSGLATYGILGQRLAQQGGQAAYVAEVQKISVQVNPRYGSWDSSKVQLVVGTGSLSSPAPTQTANP